MCEVPEGRLITTKEIREKLAEKHGATMACPMVTGIFAGIAANAAEEAAGEGRYPITPYWRTLKSGGELNDKYPGGIDNQKMRLEQEGHRVIKKGKKYFVADYQIALLK